MISVCPSCATENLSCLGEIPAADRFAGRLLPEPLQGGSLIRCEDCQLHFRYPRLSKHELDELYRKGELDIWKDQPKSRKDWQIAATWINAEGDGLKVLDVGCFDGRFLEFLGDRYHRFGIEIHETAAGIATKKGIQIIGKDYNNFKNELDPFDVIVAMDVIEHVHDPSYFLQLLEPLLKPGGIIILSTGNTQALSWKMMGSRYWYCAFAEHISFINPSWCHQVVKKVGLVIEQVIEFSHSEARVNQRIVDFGKNTAYVLVPGLIGWLRTKGFGDKDASTHKTLATYPTAWPSAKDHFITLFRK